MFYIVVGRAYQVLSDSEERKEYDRNHKRYKLKGELDPIALWDENFAENASGNDSGSESGGDDSEEEEEAMKPGKEWVKIYEEATPCVRNLLADPENSSSKSEIKRLNTQIKELNKKHNAKVKKLKEKKLEGYREARYVKEDAFVIRDFNVLKSIGLDASKAVKSLEKDPKSKRAKESQEDLEDQLERTIRINSYPQEWLNCLPWSRKDKSKRHKRPLPFSSLEEKGKGREKKKASKKDGESDIEMANAGPSSKKKGKGKMRKGTSSKQEYGESDVDMKDAVTTKRRKWNPGETRKGEKILGWRPFYKTDRKTDQQIYNGCQLVIEKRGQPNPIALVSGEEAGRRAVDAYRDLPEEEQNDIRYSEKKYTYKDAHKFDYILGFASVPSNGYALYSFTDGSEEIVSRTALRKVFGETDADCEIEEFFDEIGETPPPLRKLLTNGSKVRRKHKSRRHAHSDDESDSDSDSDSLFVSTKKKGRRQAREVDSDDSSDDSSDDGSSSGRKRSRMPKRKRNSKTKKTKAIESNNQEIFASTLQKFMKDQAKESRRREEVMSKRFDKRFEEVLRRIPA